MSRTRIIPERVLTPGEYTKRWRDKHPGYISPGDDPARKRNHHLEKKYGITAEQFDEMVAQQGGACAACGCVPVPTEDGRTNKLHVDHDHKTNKVRGLLCGPCNRAIGFIEHDLYEARLAYLARNS